MGQNLNFSFLSGLLSISGIIGWYALILMTDQTNESTIPNNYQWCGLGVTIIISILVWVNQCLTIKPH